MTNHNPKLLEGHSKFKDETGRKHEPKGRNAIRSDESTSAMSTNLTKTIQELKEILVKDTDEIPKSTFDDYWCGDCKFNSIDIKLQGIKDALKAVEEHIEDKHLNEISDCNIQCIKAIKSQIEKWKDLI